MCNKKKLALLGLIYSLSLSKSNAMNSNTILRDDSMYVPGCCEVSNTRIDSSMVDSITATIKSVDERHTEGFKQLSAEFQQLKEQNSYLLNLIENVVNPELQQLKKQNSRLEKEIESLKAEMARLYK